MPRPPGFLADHALLLILGVQGTPLGAAFDGDSSVDLVAGSLKAAEWLSALHLSSLRAGDPERASDALKQCWTDNLLSKAVEVHPKKRDMVCELTKMLDQRVARLTTENSLVLTHGRYHHDHVFLCPEATSVIDLDRCHPANPAKDVAEQMTGVDSAQMAEAQSVAISDGIAVPVRSESRAFHAPLLMHPGILN